MPVLTVANATADELHAALARAGYVPGLPPHVSPETQREDLQACRRMRCHGCRARGLAYIPYRNQHGRGYRVLARCPACGGAAEV